MAAKRVLFFDGTRVTAFLWQPGRVLTEESFLADPVGLEAFAAYLTRNQNSLFYFLADVAEEGFQIEAIPRVQGGDREVLLKRRLGQYYYGSPYSAAVSLGHSKEGRRDERILFTALTHPDTFAPWFETLRSASVALVGMYSVPLVLAEHAPAFAARQEKFLLITLSSAGVRQTFFKAGEMQFSRLASLTSRGPESFAIACGIEAAKTYQYLVGQRQITRASVLPTFVLANAEHLPLLRSHCRDTPECSFQLEDINSFSASIGLKAPLRDSSAEPMLVHRLLARPPKQQFAPAPERQIYQLWKARFALRAIAAALVVGALLMSVRQLSQWQELRQEIDALDAKATTDGMRYTAILDGLPKTQLTPESLRAVIANFDELQRRSPAIEPMLQHLGQALLDTPGIDLQRIEWAISDKPDAPGKVGAGATAAIVSASVPVAIWTVLEINAELPRSLANDQRAQVDRVERLAARLRRNGIDVNIQSLPIDIESAKPMKSRPDEVVTGSALAPPPRFSLRLKKALTL